MAYKKKEKVKGKYKYLRPEEVEELQALPLNDLLKEYSSARTNEITLKRQKKDDKDLADAKADIAKHRESFKIEGEKETVAEKIKRLQANIKELREASNEKIEDALLTKKDIEGGFNDSIKSFVEKRNVILSLIDGKTKAP